MATKKWNGMTIETEDGYLSKEAMEVFRKHLEAKKSGKAPAKKSAKKPVKKSK